MAAAKEVVVPLVYSGFDVTFTLANLNELSEHVQGEIGNTELDNDNLVNDAANSAKD